MKRQPLTLTRLAGTAALFCSSCLGPTPGLAELDARFPEPSFFDAGTELLVEVVLPDDGSGGITLAWSACPHPLASVEQRREGCLQYYETPYRPVAAEFMAPNLLAISGCDNGVAVVEIWELEVPELETSLTDDWALDSDVYPVSVRRVYSDEDSEEPLGHVTMLGWNRGDEHSLFVRVQQSADMLELLWSEDDDEGELDLCISAVDFPALAQLPYDRFRGGDHRQEGYVYALEVKGKTDSTPTLFFRDANRDGVVDAVELIEAGQPWPLELELSNWAEYRGFDLEAGE